MKAKTEERGGEERRGEESRVMTEMRWEKRFLF